MFNIFNLILCGWRFIKHMELKTKQHCKITRTELQSNRNVLISVVIPVYNVYEWIDLCLESVINQTFDNFEVILINDGSTDGSDLKCIQWAKKDLRIRVIHKINEGPSVARNIGIQEARGKYLVFIDSDDWIDKSYLETMYNRAIETNADLVECDVYRVNNETGIETYRVCSGVMGQDYTLEDHMKYGYTAMWKCLIKKDLFTRNEIKFADCHSEARAIYPLLLALANRIENVHAPLYHYRIFRKDSLTAKPRPHHEDVNAIGILALELLIQGFQKCGLYQRYKDTLQQLVQLKLTDLLAVFFYRKEYKDYQQLRENYYTFVSKTFPDISQMRYITVGGYNLNRILMHMNLLQDPYCRFNFTSFISLMHPVKEKILCKHKNRYREMMLKREIQNQFWNILDEMKPKYLFIDLIEERFDLVVCGEGYLTKSDAFDGAECCIGPVYTIARTTQECENLWKQSCKQFINRIKTSFPFIRIVLVKNYLSEKKGDINSQQYFENLEEIRQINHILEEYYQFFAGCDKEIQVVEASECDYYFTDAQYEYGAIPSHLNELVNQKIAGLIERSIGI